MTAGTLTRPALFLTHADFRVLRLMFVDARTRGRLSQKDYDRTAYVLQLAADMQTWQAQRLLSEVAG